MNFPICECNFFDSILQRIIFFPKKVVCDLMPQPDDFNLLLESAAAGDQEAAEQLFPVVYRELHQIASRYMSHERPDHTLQPTALIHEAFLRLTGANGKDKAECEPPPDSSTWQNRAHFINTAALVMRRILVNHAKAKSTAKRGGDQNVFSLEQVAEVFTQRSVDLIALDDALDRLAELDPVQHRLVHLRFFAGVSTQEAAKLLGISERAAYYEWAHARAWLQTQIIIE